MVMENSRFKLLFSLLEKETIFLNPNLKTRDVARFLNLSTSEFKRLLYKELYLDWDTLVDSYRLDHAKNMVMEYNVDYQMVWKLSGFKSCKRFERVLKKMDF